MKYLKHLCIGAFLSLVLTNANAQNMNNELLGKILTQVSDSISGQPGYWEVAYGNMGIIVVTDQKQNRMRMVTPIAYINELDELTYKEALEANYHTALDIKYAISNEVMWSVFIHPLKELSEAQVKDAIRQVYNGARSFGNGYSSTNLVFGKN